MILGRPYVYGTSSRVSVTGSSTVLAAATTGWRAVIISVPPDATAGIHVHVDEAGGVDAATTHFRLYPGATATYYTAKAIKAIRAGAANVTVDVQPVTRT